LDFGLQSKIQNLKLPDGGVIMARVVGRSTVREGIATSTKLSESAVFIAIAIALLLGARWYFVVYKNSPGVALGEFLGGIKAGNVERQYAMIDDSDKQILPSQKDYGKMQWARGYTERIANISMLPEVKDLKDPDIVTVEATLNVRGAAGKDLLQQGESTAATDKYTLRKDKDGHWKVWLQKSPMTSLLKVQANAPGDSF
jgi:hypothetical protein